MTPPRPRHRSAAVVSRCTRRVEALSTPAATDEPPLPREVPAVNVTHGQNAIGIVGGTGQTGTAVARALRASGSRVVLLSRRPPADGAGQWRYADMTDPASLEGALTGLHGLYVVPPRLDPDEAELVGHVFAAAEVCGLQRLVYHSVMHPATADVPHHVRKANAEARLRQSDLRWTIVQPNTYAQNVFKRLRRRDETVEVLSAWPIDSPGLAFVDLNDVAEAAARILADTSHVYATHELAGPQVLTPGGLAEELSRAWQAPVCARESGTELEPTCSDLRHLSDHYAYHAHYAAHGFPGSPYVLERILGRPATPLADVARRIGLPPA